MAASSGGDGCGRLKAKADGLRRRGPGRTTPRFEVGRRCMPPARRLRPSRTNALSSRSPPSQNARRLRSSRRRGRQGRRPGVHGRPGGNDAYASSDLASNAGRATPSRCSRARVAGSSRPRPPLSSVIDAGSGAYDAKRPSKPRRRSSSFVEDQPRRTRRLRAPGVGSYDPRSLTRCSAVSRRSRTASSGSRRTRRWRRRRTWGRARTPTRSARSNLSQVKTSSVGFQSTQKRPELAQVTDTPGPGSYSDATKGAPDTRPSSAFKSSTKRGKDADLAYMGDPGAYDPYANSDLASNAGKSYAKSMQSGTGGFGSSAPARAPLSSVIDAPGPGAYDAKRRRSRRRRRRSPRRPTAARTRRPRGAGRGLLRPRGPF